MSDNAETREALRREIRENRERFIENEMAYWTDLREGSFDDTEYDAAEALETALDAADEAGEFGECCGDTDCRACNVLMWIHTRLAALASPAPTDPS